MQSVTLVGVDLGKHSFHLHGQDQLGRAVFRKKVSRKQLVEFFATFHACTVVMEACAGPHYLARKLAGFGHQVKRGKLRPTLTRGNSSHVAIVAVARELSGFIWDIGRLGMTLASPRVAQVA